MSHRRVELLSVLVVITVVGAQRPFFAGSRSNGYKDRFVPASNNNNSNNQVQSDTVLQNRFSDSGPQPAGITERIPYDALGDLELIKQIQKMPPQIQPFWYLNYKAIEAARNRTYQQNESQKIANRLGTIQDKDNMKKSTIPIVYPEENTINGTADNRLGSDERIRMLLTELNQLLREKGLSISDILREMSTQSQDQNTTKS